MCEGAITIQQQAQRFALAMDDETRADAAQWAYDGYILLGRGLPDSYQGVMPDERATGWLTAKAISRLFGAEMAWRARVRLAFASLRPDASQHAPDPDYLRGLLLLAGLTQRKAAEAIGISDRLMRYYLAEGTADYRPAPYPVQYALERLARIAS